MESIESTGNIKCKVDLLKIIKNMSIEKQEEFINWIITKINERGNLVVKKNR